MRRREKVSKTNTKLNPLSCVLLEFFCYLGLLEKPYWLEYKPFRMQTHNFVTSKYFDLAISAIIGINVITMAMEFYMMPKVRRDICSILVKM